MLKNICPHCKKEIEISEDKLGEVVTCDFCEKSFRASRIFVSNADPVPSSSSEPDGKDTSHADISTERFPEMEAKSPAPDKTGGFFHEINYRGRHFTVESLKHLKKRFVIFSVLSVFLISSLIALFNGSFDSFPGGSAILIILLLFVSWFIFYGRLFLALKESEPRIRTKLLLLVATFVFPVAYAFCKGIVEKKIALVCLVVLLFINGFVFLMSILDSIIIFGLAMIAAADRRVKNALRLSLILLPILVSLCISSYFFGSVRSTTNLCENCGIWSETESICLFGIPLFFYTNHTPTAFSQFLDSEHRCRHRDGERFISQEARYAFAIPESGHDPRSDVVDEIGQQRHEAVAVALGYTPKPVPFFMKSYSVDDFVEVLDNIRADSPLYEFLCEKDSKDYARRLLTSELTSEEVEQFYRRFID